MGRSRGEGSGKGLGTVSLVFLAFILFRLLGDAGGVESESGVVSRLLFVEGEEPLGVEDDEDPSSGEGTERCRAREITSSMW